MAKLNKILLLIFFVWSFSSSAQDMQFTQFYSSPTYLNPAFTGAGACSRVSTTYRNQWAGIQKGYQSFLFSIDHALQYENLGVGLMIGNEVAGTGDLTRTTVHPLIAYEAKLTKKMVIRFGLQPGIGLVSVNYDHLLFGDQIVRGGGVPTIESPPQSIVYPDLGAGVLTYNDKFWAGMSIYHLNKPRESVLNGFSVSVLNVKFSAHGGYKFLLDDEDTDAEKLRSISFAFNYRSQLEFDQLDLGGYFSKGMINFGLWYRGLPLVKSYLPGYSNNDALAVIVGYRNKRMNIGYSYDITISKLTMGSWGAHELTFAYQMCNPKKKKRRRRVSAPCPKF